MQMGKEVSRFGRVSRAEGTSLRARPDAADEVKATLPFNACVFVSREIPGDWSFVTLGGGQSGFVQ